MDKKQKIYTNFDGKNFTQIRNEPLRDKNLSWKAKGILTYLASLPEDWEIYKSEVAKHSKDKISSFNSGWEELKKFGYIKGRKMRHNGKFVGYEWFVSDMPTLLSEMDFPFYENPYSGKTKHGKTNTTNTNYTNTNLTNTNIIDEEEINKFIQSNIYLKEDTLQKILGVKDYLEKSGVYKTDILEILNFFSTNNEYLISEFIMQQVERCLLQSKLDEGLYSYHKFFIKGLIHRVNSQKSLSYVENNQEFCKVFGMEALPEVPLYNWIDEKWLEGKER